MRVADSNEAKKNKNLGLSCLSFVLQQGNGTIMSSGLEMFG